MSILDRIAAQRRQDVALSKELFSMAALNSALETFEMPALNLYTRLLSDEPMALMAEIKRASPSKGDISLDVDVSAQALAYARGGASVISVLTEPKWFKGTLEDMSKVRSLLDSSDLMERPAILCKDFIVDVYQIGQARLHGADTILLIVAILSDDEITELLNEARRLNMEALVEVNCSEEMSRALRLGARVVGVNNRNLHHFKVDMGTTIALATQVPSDVILVALSGISTRGDVERFASVGVKAILVGEALMRASNPAIFIGYLLHGLRREPLVKICGMRDVTSAKTAVNAGADLIGFIFADTRRHISVEAASQIVKSLRKDTRYEQKSSLLTDLRDLAESPTATASPVAWFNATAQVLERAVHQRQPLTVGVFMDASVDEITRVANDVPLDLIQLHSREPFGFAASIPVPVIRVLHVEPTTSSDSLSSMLEHATRERAAMVLFDAKAPGDNFQGGCGNTFEWNILQSISRDIPFAVAGGLTPHNLASLRRLVSPWAIDVSSGIEQDGVHDLSKVTTFVNNAKKVLKEEAE